MTSIIITGLVSVLMCVLLLCWTCCQTQTLPEASSTILANRYAIPNPSSFMATNKSKNSIASLKGSWKQTQRKRSRCRPSFKMKIDHHEVGRKASTRTNKSHTKSSLKQSLKHKSHQTACTARSSIGKVKANLHKETELNVCLKNISQNSACNFRKQPKLL